MKKVLFSFAAACACACMLTSCAAISSPVGMGAFYTGVQSGMTTTSNNVGKKVGTSKAINVLGFVASGDASINSAAKNAGIKKISHVDQKQTSILGLFSTYETIVYGE